MNQLPPSKQQLSLPLLLTAQLGHLARGLLAGSILLVVVAVVATEASKLIDLVALVVVVPHLPRVHGPMVVRHVLRVQGAFCAPVHIRGHLAIE